MTSSASAATKTFVGSAGPPDPNAVGTGEWSNPSYWNPVGAPVETWLTADYVKVEGTKVCTLNSVAGDFNYTKVTVAGTSPTGATLNIVSGSIGIGNEFQVSDASKTGVVNQTGGVVTTRQGSTAGKIEIGYKTGIGYYTISGGSIGFSGTSNVGQILVGGAGTPGATGTFTIHGHAATINTDRFWVGTKDASAGYPGTGTVAFELTGNVSPINVQSLVTIDNAGAASTANLVVALTDEDVPPGIIPLIVNSSGTAVSGTFDTVSGDQNGGRALEGDTVVLLTPGLTPYTYYMSYRYNKETGKIGTGNDVALVPEPATIALLSLGLLLIRRNRK